MSQREVADLMGISQSMVRKVEHRALEKMQRAVMDDPVLREVVLERMPDARVGDKPGVKAEH